MNGSLVDGAVRMTPITVVPSDVSPELVRRPFTEQYSNAPGVYPAVMSAASDALAVS